MFLQSSEHGDWKGESSRARRLEHTRSKGHTRNDFGSIVPMHLILSARKSSDPRDVAIRNSVLSCQGARKGHLHWPPLLGFGPREARGFLTTKYWISVCCIFPSPASQEKVSTSCANHKRDWIIQDSWHDTTVFYFENFLTHHIHLWVTASFLFSFSFDFGCNLSTLIQPRQRRQLTGLHLVYQQLRYVFISIIL